MISFLLLKKITVTFSISDKVSEQRFEFVKLTGNQVSISSLIITYDQFYLIS